MIMLTIRGDNPMAEIGLYNGTKQLAYVTWEAHYQLAETLHTKIKELLESQTLGWQDVAAFVVYQGPGSFTGLRISLSVANALADSLSAPIVGTTGEDWVARGLQQLAAGKDQKQVVPEYGAPVHITKPRK